MGSSATAYSDLVGVNNFNNQIGTSYLHIYRYLLVWLGFHVERYEKY